MRGSVCIKNPFKGLYTHTHTDIHGRENLPPVNKRRTEADVMT